MLLMIAMVVRCQSSYYIWSMNNKAAHLSSNGIGGVELEYTRVNQLNIFFSIVLPMSLLVCLLLVIAVQLKFVLFHVA